MILENKKNIIGCDEVGYGAWSGPVVVCGVKASKDWIIDGLGDSKQLTPKKRGVMSEILLKNKDITYHIAQRDNIHIDKVGLGLALKECYVEVFKMLYDVDSLIIVDGILKFDKLGVDDYDKMSVIKADAKFPTVMAASIIAKEFRDPMMHEYHKTYPNYGWDSNVGYGASAHKKGIKEFGFTPLHRMSYKIKL